MTFNKLASNAMTYEQTPVRNTPQLGHTALIKAADRLSSTRLVWILIKRHKVHMLVIANVAYFIALPAYKFFVA